MRGPQSHLRGTNSKLLRQLVGKSIMVQGVSDVGNLHAYTGGILEKLDNVSNKGYYFWGKQIPLRAIEEVRGSLLIIKDDYMEVRV